MSLSDHHHLGDRRRLPPILARRRKNRILCDLPVELLCIIVSHVLSDRETVRMCTLVCRCLRDVSLEHLFGTRLVARRILTFDHIISFLESHPRICAKIRTLYLHGDTTQNSDQHLQCTLFASIDDTAVRTLMRLLPNIQHLYIYDFKYTLPPQITQQRTLHNEQNSSEPFRLQQLSFNPGYFALPHETAIAGLFRILSLFTIDLLCATFTWSQRDTVPFDVAALHRSLKIKDLHLSYCRGNEETDSMLKILNMFTQSLEPGSLQHFSTRCHTVSEVSAIGELLASAGPSLRSLQIMGDASLYPSLRKDWKDPLDSTFLF